MEALQKTVVCFIGFDSCCKQVIASCSMNSLLVTSISCDYYFKFCSVGVHTKGQDHESKDQEEAAIQEAAMNAPQFEREAQPSRKKGWELYGVEMSPDTIAIAMVYFVQGILGLAQLAVRYFLKDDLGLDPAEVIYSWLLYFIFGQVSVLYVR